MDACKAATPERAARHRWNEPSQLFQPLALMGVISVWTCGGSAVNRGRCRLARNGGEMSVRSACPRACGSVLPRCICHRWGPLNAHMHAPRREPGRGLLTHLLILRLRRRGCGSRRCAALIQKMSKRSRAEQPPSSLAEGVGGRTPARSLDPPLSTRARLVHSFTAVIAASNCEFGA